MTPEQLRATRMNKGFTQPQMAKYLGVPLSSYRNWEQGVRECPVLVDKVLDVMEELYRADGVSYYRYLMRCDHS